MTEQQRNILAAGSLGLVVVGVGYQFGIGYAAIVAGVVGIALALVLAVGAVR